jgi:hypothetical protein
MSRIQVGCNDLLLRSAKRSKKVRNTHLLKRSFVFTGGMNTKQDSTQQSKNQLWGIYQTDREYARELGDPLRTVVEAPTKIAAEELAARLGFDAPWAHPVRPEEVEHARWLPLKRDREQITPIKHISGIHI